MSLKRTEQIKNNYKELISSIESNEGFRNMPYQDTLGYPTIGYGTKLPISKKEAELLLENRLFALITELQLKEPFIKDLPVVIQEVLYEMAYQLGISGLLKFKHMLKACKENDWNNMIKEMKDSKWYQQTPHRVDTLVNKIQQYINNESSS